MNDIQILQQLEHIAEDKSGESAYLLKCQLEGMRKVIDDYLDKVEDAMLAICLEQGSIEIPIDDQGHKECFWAGHPKDTKCRDVRVAIHFLMGLDLEALEDCLSANAIKHGAFRKVLESIGQPEKFDEFFSVTVLDKLESGDKLPKKLMQLNTKFLK